MSTIAVYLSVYLLACLTTHLANRIWKAEKNRIAVFLLLSAAVVVLSLLAALRDPSVGTDTRMYFERFAAISGMDSLSEALSAYADEPGYLAANFLVSRATSNPQVFIFAIALITHGLVVKALFDNRSRISMAYGLMVYLLLFYQMSFNYLRQCLAMAVCFYILRLFPEKRTAKILLWAVLAALFHYSGVMILVLYALYRLSAGRWRKLGWVLVYGGLIVFFFFFREIMTVIFQLIPALNKPKYLLYIMGSDAFSVGYLNLLVKAPAALCLLLFRRSLQKRDALNPFLIRMVFFDLVLSQIGELSPQAHRISLYAEYAKILIIPQTALIFGNRRYRILIRTLFILYLLVFWYIFYILKNYNQTNPYIFLLP